MGYHAAIVRKLNGKEYPLREDEVRALTATIPSSRIDPCSLKDGELDFVISKNDSISYRFVLQHGQLWTKNPSDDEIETMLEVAHFLNARVRGDEFETYRSVNDTYIHPDDKEEFDQAKRQAKRAIIPSRLIPSIIKIAALLIFLMGLLLSFFKK